VIPTIITLVVITLISTVHRLLGPKLYVDILFFLYNSTLLDAGYELNVDIIDINSPLMFYLNLFIFRLAKFIEAKPETVLILCFTLIVFLCLYRLLKLINIYYDNKLHGYILSTILSILFLFSGTYFFQRDYVITLMAVIYLFSLANKLTNKPNRGAFLSGWFLGFVSMIKPQYVLGPLAMEAGVYAIKRKGYRVTKELWGFCVGFASSLVLLLITDPEYFYYMRRFASSYFQFIPAVRYILLYYAYLLSSLVFMLIATKKVAKKNISLLVITSCLFISSLLSTLTQNKGFPYHFYLGNISLVIVLFLFASQIKVTRTNINLLGVLKGYFFTFSMVIAIALVLVTPIAESYTQRWTTTQPEFRKLVDLNNRYATNSYYAILSPDLYPACLLGYESQLTWALRYFSLWYLPGMYKDQSMEPFNKPNEMNDIETETYHAIIEDLLTHRPSILYIDNRMFPDSSNGNRPGLLEYYSQEKSFRSFFTEYEHYGTTYHDTLEVFMRK
jgi:hypothetical protein